MRQFQTAVQTHTRPFSLINITSQVQQAVNDSGISTGLCTLFLRHTSASLVIQENADPNVLLDLEMFMKKYISQNEPWRHTDEGPDDMPSHVRTVLTHTSEQIPVRGGKLGLGRWQGIYVWEHRACSHERELIVHIVGE